MDQLFSELKEVISQASGETAEGKEGTKEGKKGLNESQQALKPLALKRDLCYIVTAVVIKDGKVLMMKEAKISCRGKWYLPAGRVEKNESLIEGVKREMLEETGLVFEPTTLVCVDDSPTLSWHRFNFTGNITGGKLKTIQDADKESMEAGWFEPQDIFSCSIPLRAPDIIPLIKSTLKWEKMKERDPSFISLPVPIPHERMVIQVVVVACDGSDGIKVCFDRKKHRAFLHCSQSTLHGSVRDIAHYMTIKALGSEEADYQLHGVLSIEHVGKPHGVADGLCITLLAEIPAPQKASDSAQYLWCEVPDPGLKTRMRQLLKKGCVEII